jgi:hypothetical protein
VIVDLFADVSREYLRDAAVYAAHALGVFDAETVVGGPPRMRALYDVLALEGPLVKQGDGYLVAAVPPVPRTPEPEGWGRLAEVLRTGQPLVAGEIARYHAHLRAVGAESAREWVARLAPRGDLLDAGGGAGAYTQAWLAATPHATATLVDRPEVLALARTALAPFDDRVRLVEADLLGLERSGHALGLLANVLHLYPADRAAELVRRVTRAVAPGGRVEVIEVYVAPDRSGPPLGLYFALNMALYTDGGSTYDPEQIAGWMRAAGLDDLRVEKLASAPGSVVVSGLRW